MIDIIKNVSKITSIPYTNLQELINNLDMCISHESLSIEDDIVKEMDIGIGILKIKFEDDQLSYKFIPSSKLEKMIVQTVRTGQSPITRVCEEKITKRLLDTYKDLL